MQAACFFGSLPLCFEHAVSAACFTSDSSNEKKKTLSLSSRMSRGSRPDRCEWSAAGAAFASAAGAGSAVGFASAAGAAALFYAVALAGVSAGGVALPPHAAAASNQVDSSPVRYRF
jgi:hypothetical protein